MLYVRAARFLCRWKVFHWGSIDGRVRWDIWGWGFISHIFDVFMHKFILGQLLNVIFSELDWETSYYHQNNLLDPKTIWSSIRSIEFLYSIIVTTHELLDRLLHIDNFYLVSSGSSRITDMFSGYCILRLRIMVSVRILWSDRWVWSRISVHRFMNSRVVRGKCFFFWDVVLRISRGILSFF